MFTTHIKRSISVLSILTLLMAMFLMAGCQQQTPKEEKKADVPAAVTITDQAGREVTLPGKVERAVSTWRPCTFLIYAVGAQEKLVGVDIGSTKDPFPTAVYPAVKQLTQVGDKKSGINVEAVVSTKPDVVFVWSGKDSAALIEQLEKQKIATVVLVPESAEEMKTATELVGKVLGCSEQAQKVLQYYDDTINLVNQKLSGLSEQEKKKVYLAGANGFLSSCGTDFYQNYLIEKAGGINVAAALQGGWQNVSAEQLVSWGPDVVVIDPYCKESAEDAVSINPGLKAIPALKANAVYSFPAVGQWTFPIPQSAMGVLWLSQNLYPEKFADINFESQADQYYKEFFGITYSEIVNSAKNDSSKKQ